MSRDQDRLPTEPAAAGGQGDPLIGVVLAGKYKVLELVARGGMGRIYRAEQAPLGREVALKILSRPLLGSDADDAGLQKRFLLEAATCARLVHPNTVRVFDYGAIVVAGEPTFFMVMEFLRGRTLSQALRADGPFSAGRVVRIAVEILRSLREAHKAGVVHRDLKPSNVMLSDGDEGELVKVVDFGVAKVLSASTEALTSDGSFVGSPRYTAPEQIRQEGVDGRADLYALGVLMFELLTGKPPFSSNEPVRTLLMHLNEPVPPLVVAGGVPPVVEQIVRRLLEKAPADRFDSADAAYDAMRRLRTSLAPDYPELAVDPTWEEDPADARSLGIGRTGSHSGLQSRGAATEALAPPGGEPDVTDGSGTTHSPRRAPWIFIGVLVGALVAAGFTALGGGLWLAWQPAETDPLPPTNPVLQEALAGIAATQLVRVESSPSGATVVVDAIAQGKTPIELELNLQSPQEVLLRLAGHDDVAVDATELLAGPKVYALKPTAPVVPRPKGTAKPGAGGGKNDDILLER